MYKHTFNDKQEFLSSSKDAGTTADVVGHIIITNNIAEYPWPVRLEEGVIVQDTDQVPFEKKWRPKKEAEAMKAKRDGKTKS